MQAVWVRGPGGAGAGPRLSRPALQLTLQIQGINFINIVSQGHYLNIAQYITDGEIGRI